MIILLLVLSRIADLITTYIRTPDLSDEANPVVRWMGWRLNIGVNVIAIALLPMFPRAAIAVIVLSFLAALWNLLLLANR